jgi:SM-20-related protein
MTEPGRNFVQQFEGLLDQAFGVLEAALVDPAVPVEQRAALALRLVALGAGDQPSAPRAPPEPVTLPVVFATIPGFLPPELYRDVVAFAQADRGRLEPSTVTSNIADYRQSRVMYGFPELEHRVIAEVTAALPEICTALGCDTFTPARIELQLTAHGDGDYFKVHSDTGVPETDGRTLTFVIYFQLRNPRGFEGGELRIYQTEFSAERAMRPRLDVCRDLAPDNNLVVFFDSRLAHEVLPVRVPSGTYEDGRFTLNGWLHRSVPA